MLMSCHSTSLILNSELLNTSVSILVNVSLHVPFHVVETIEVLIIFCEGHSNSFDDVQEPTHLDILQHS